MLSHDRHASIKLYTPLHVRLTDYRVARSRARWCASRPRESVPSDGDAPSILGLAMPRVSGRGEQPPGSGGAADGLGQGAAENVAEGLLAAAAEHPEAAAGLVSVAREIGNPSELLSQARDIHSVEDAVDVASSITNKVTSTTAGQKMIEQAAKAKELYDAQTTGRITNAADHLLRGAQKRLMERATGPGVRLPSTLSYRTALRPLNRTHALRSFSLEGNQTHSVGDHPALFVRVC